MLFSNNLNRQRALQLLLAVCFLLGTSAIRAQGLDPIRVPEQIKFANIELTLDKDAQDAVQKKVNGLMRSASFYRSFTERCDVFFPIIEKVFEEEKLPEDFKFLALQESALIADAVSRSNAVGFWQFKEGTAREQGLKVDKTIDERKNIYTASRGAAKYLKKNNYFMRNWVYSLLSYNLGLTGANSILDRSLVGAEKMSLNKDTHIYIIHFLAHKIAFEGVVGKDNSNTQLTLVEYPNPKGKKIRDIAKEVRVEEELLRKYNRWMEGESVPSSVKMPPFYIPVKIKDKQELLAKLPGNKKEGAGSATGTKDRPGKGSAQDSKYPVITAERTQKVGGQKVKFANANGREAVLPSKDTDMASLIGGLDISRKRFMRLNDMDISSELNPEVPYYLTRKKAKTPTDAEFHTLQHGETLWDVAQIYAMKERSLRRKNRIDDEENIQPGRVLWLKKKRPRKVNVEIKDIGPAPEKDEDSTPEFVDVDEDEIEKILDIDDGDKDDKGPVMPIPTNGRFHVVQTGETLFAISRAYKISTLRLKELNDLPEDLKLKEGQILIVREETEKKPPSENPADGSSLEEEVVLIDADGNIIEGGKEIKNPVGGITSNPSINEDPNINAIIHIVRANENLYTISKSYKISSEDIVRWNKLDPLRVLQPGQRLYVSNPNVQLPPSGGQVGGDKPSDGNTNKNPVVAREAKQHVVQSQETLYGISRQYNVKVSEIIAWNNLDSSKPIAVGQRIVVEDPSKVQATANSGNNASGSGTKTLAYHKVQQGENLGGIAYKYGITVDQIRQMNNLNPSEALLAGQMLLIKDSSQQPAAGTGSSISGSSTMDNMGQPQTKPGTTPGATAKVHTVKPGDTVYGLSRAYNISPQQLKEWNGMKDNTLSLGQKLMVGYNTSTAERPRVGSNTGFQQGGDLNKTTSTANNTTAGVTKTTPPKEVYHTVQKGDTLYSIARNNNLTINELKILNDGLTTNISIGQKIRVK